ncbi:MAG: hypothetical protein MRZ79_25855 [Bacteroidia bacterium]|nr:hypothetical protein [Bacteroidia bacterium]
MKTKKQIRVKIVNPASLSSKQKDQMCAVYLRHHNISKEECLQRITGGFDRIVLFVSKEEGKIVGFNGIRISIFKHEGFRRPVFSLYIGQLFIEKAYRGNHPIQRFLFKIMLRQQLLRPWLKPIIWADSLTFKPYILIAQNNREFYPHPDVETPANYKSFMDFLGTQRYGGNYDPETGCVSKDKKLIKDHVAPIYPRLLENKYIRFYAERNKGYQKGNGMLVCTPWSWDTSIRLFKKFTRNGFQRFGSIFKLRPNLNPS